MQWRRIMLLIEEAKRGEETWYVCDRDAIKERRGPLEEWLGK